MGERNGGWAAGRGANDWACAPVGQMNGVAPGITWAQGLCPCAGESTPPSALQGRRPWRVMARLLGRRPMHIVLPENEKMQKLTTASKDLYLPTQSSNC